MRDRVILMVGLYDTLDIFTYELKKEFEKIGLEVMIFNSQDMEGSMIKLSEFIKEPVKAVVTFTGSFMNSLSFIIEPSISCELNIITSSPIFSNSFFSS